MTILLRLIIAVIFISLTVYNIHIHEKYVLTVKELEETNQTLDDFLAFKELLNENVAETDISKQLTDIRKDIRNLIIGINSMTKSYADAVCINGVKTKEERECK